MTRQAAPRLRRFAAATALLTAAVATATVTATALPAQAASNIGGSITRSEVLVRGNDWVSRNVPYNQGSYEWDLDHDKTYRQDCSGFVSMAWHLSGSLNTDGLDSRSVTTRIAKGDLQPGDALDNDPHDGSTFQGAHVILFDHWIDRSTGEFAYMAEAGTRYGTVTGRDHLDGGTDGNIAGHPAGGYFALRYNKIVGDSTPVGVGQVGGASVYNPDTRTAEVFTLGRDGAMGHSYST
ncbi:hypothetical protein ACFWCR_17055, partial [Streptomyces goshikiensis]